MSTSSKKPAALLQEPQAPQGRQRSTGAATNPVGRPVGRNSDQTRLAILDVAEGLFAELGYEGTSIRDIALQCNVQAAVVGYHFGTKAELFDAIVGRRAAIINEVRTRALDAQLGVLKGRPLRIEMLVENYVAPLLEATTHGEPGWRNFASLMGRLANSPRGTEMVNKHYSKVAFRYMQEFRRALPKVPEGRLTDAFLYMVAAMLFVCADTGRWEAMVRHGNKKHRSTRAILDHLVPFVTGGFSALAKDRG